MKILDLFCGIGGTARGIQSVLIEKKIHYQYYAIDNNSSVLVAHIRNNPSSLPIISDAWEYLVFHHQEFDFIWASPPCQTHSKLNNFRRKKGIAKPDNTLWKIIHFLKRNFEGAWVVENVEPYYTPPYLPSIKIGRHLFWSNFPILPFEEPRMPKEFRYMTTKDYEDWLGLQGLQGLHYDKRQSLRNAVHPLISRNIFLQWLEPRQYQLEVFL